MTGFLLSGFVCMFVQTNTTSTLIQGVIKPLMGIDKTIDEVAPRE